MQRYSPSLMIAEPIPVSELKNFSACMSENSESGDWYYREDVEAQQQLESAVNQELRDTIVELRRQLAEAIAQRDMAHRELIHLEAAVGVVRP